MMFFILQVEIYKGMGHGVKLLANGAQTVVLPCLVREGFKKNPEESVTFSALGGGRWGGRRSEVTLLR